MKAIPQPDPYPLLGNVPDLEPEAITESMIRLAKEYGPIYRLKFPTQELIVVSSQELVNEVCDQTRFDKQLIGPLVELRDITGDGLFTSRTDEPNWGCAHRILASAFGPVSLRNMFDSMWDIAEQLLLKWERQSGEHPIDVADNMVRLTLDTLALCAFSYRFNSFYEKEMHPFIGAMVRGMEESLERLGRPALVTRLMLWKARQRAEDLRLMNHTADEIIAQRKKHGDRTASKDLLDLMLWGRDPRTGEGLSDENIRYQMITFLIAGHETTSGLLTFTLYGLLENPAILAKARAEVDRVLGNETPRYEHISHLSYLDHVLKESLRLWPPAPAFALHPLEKETTIGGEYSVRTDEVLFVLLPMLHRDPKVWGDDTETFNPDRFAPEAYEKLPPNSWKPFGNGKRACIGRPFALQEATLVLASILQRFELTKADPNYKLHITESLTNKPEGFFIKAKRRDIALAPKSPALGAQEATQAVSHPGREISNGIPVRVLFGSNSGSSEAFAQRIATDAKSQGYVSSLGTLDSAVGNLPREGAVVIVTASYEGQPTDNARQFMPWLEGLSAGSLDGVKFAVFGCGNKDWVRTYQKVPKRIDARLHETGAQRLIERGEGDARGDFFGDFERWYAPFWKTIGAAFGQEARETAPAPQLELKFVEGTREPMLRQNKLQNGEVKENRELVDTTSPLGASKRHIEIALPPGSSYRAGDYLTVLPSNPPENVGRALRRVGLSYDAQVVLHPSPGVETFFPTRQPIMAGELLASYVELGLPATRQQIQKLAVSTSNPTEKQTLEALAQNEEAHASEIMAKRVSVLDLLEENDLCDLPFAALLQMLTPLKPRQYSISSSPRWNEKHCTITVAVVTGPAWSGQGIYHGVSSTYLAHARPGMKIAVTTRPSQEAFHLPESLATPLIMIGAGTGLAPFRGFIQERALRAAEEGGPIGETLLFFGCGHPDVDFLYRDELKEWEQKGVVKVHAAFSKCPDGDVKYVQDRLWKDRAAVMALMDQGAHIYVCGDGRHMAPAVRETIGRIYEEHTGGSAERVEAWLLDLEKNIRYSQDVFA